MPFYKISKLFLIFFFWYAAAFSQNFPGRNYNAYNDLPNNAVRSLLIDSNNFLWIGTENGVVKKENDVFKYFFEEDGLALNSCWAIAEDNSRNLWFGSYGKGISVYDGSNFKIISEKDGLAHDEITSLYSYGENMLAGTSNGISLINIHTYQVQTIEKPAGKDLFRVHGFFEIENHLYAVIYNYGVFEINFKNGKSDLARVNDYKKLYSILVREDSLYSSHKGYLTKAALKEYFKGDTSIAKTRFGHSIIWDYAETKDDKIFAAAWGIYDSSGGIYEIINDQLVSRASDFNIPSNEVISLAYDALFEKLYVGTRDAGLFEVKLNSQVKFNQIPGKDVLGFARTTNSSAMLLNDGIDLKTHGQKNNIGLGRLKSWQEAYVANTSIPLPRHEDEFYELEYSMPAGDISFYDLKVVDNTYWLNTNIGIFAITEKGELERYIPLHSEEINFTASGKLIETHPYGGVRVYHDLETFEYTHFLKDDPNTPTLVVNSLRQDDKTYLTSVFSGLYSIKNRDFRSYLKDGTWTEGRLRHITSLGQNLAISTDFGDVFILNDEQEFRILKKIPRAKIQGNTISFLDEYEGYLLIGTEKGLTLYKDNRYVFLDEEQGLAQPFYSAEIRGQHLSIGSNNGYYTVDLEEVRDTRPLLKDLKIEEININNEEFPFEPLASSEELKLSYDQNTVLLKFSTNAHPFPHKLSYQYRLHSNEAWSIPSAKPEIFLPSLPSNEYNIGVKVLDKSTGLDYTQSLIQFSILPPFWKTWWFALLILSTLLIGIAVIYQYQIRQNKHFEAQKRLIQKRFEETKMEALLAQMNPHFIFNAMNSIQNYIMDSDIDNATLFLGDFAKLIRLNLDHCTKPTILLVEEIEYLQSYIRVENTRFNNSIKVVMEVDPDIDTYEVEIPTMILQTFIENVFVHAFPEGVENPTLRVSFRLLSEHILECRIEDNGIGFSSVSANKLHTSKGVKLVRERLELLGYQEKAIQITSHKNKGTSVVLTLDI